MRNWRFIIRYSKRFEGEIEFSYQQDTANREPQETLRLEFDASVGKLLPLMERIKETDELIDQIVYKLYGLTEEEIGIVEGKAIG